MDENPDDLGEMGLSSASSECNNYRSPSVELDHYIVEVEETEEDDYYDDDGKSELACPFCSDDFDVVGLCCHIDDAHPIEAKSEICPICVTKVGTSMAAHIITQHETILKTLCNKKLRSGGSRSALSLLRKELQDKHLQALPKGSSCAVSSSNTGPDPLLLSFICSIPPPHKKIIQASSSTDTSLLEKSQDENLSKRDIDLSPLSNKEQEEQTQRCEFVHGLLFSTIFDDN